MAQTPTPSAVPPSRKPVRLKKGTGYVLAAGTLMALLALAGPRYPDPPPPAHTGGFGEPTCHACHFDGPLNAPEGTFRVTGVPDRYTAGARYALTVSLTHPQMQRGGFQLAARRANGTQAGHFPPADGLTVDTAVGIAYVRPTTIPWAADTSRWTFTWTAPDTTAGPVAFHAAANAANGDDSDFGDFIYTWEARTRSRKD